MTETEQDKAEKHLLLAEMECWDDPESYEVEPWEWLYFILGLAFVGLIIFVVEIIHG